MRWEDHTLMDGGVANNSPISHAVQLGAERIYVLPTGHAGALHSLHDAREFLDAGGEERPPSE